MSQFLQKPEIYLSLTGVSLTTGHLWHVLPCFHSWNLTGTANCYEAEWCMCSFFLWAWCNFNPPFCHIACCLIMPSLCILGQHKSLESAWWHLSFWLLTCPLHTHSGEDIRDTRNIENSPKSYHVFECSIGDNWSLKKSNARAAWILWIQLDFHDTACYVKLKGSPGKKNQSCNRSR